MDCLIGIKTKDFVLIAADTNISSSILLIKNTEDKFYKIGENTILAYSGDQGDSTRTCAYVAERMEFEALHNDVDVNPFVVCNVLQKQIHQSLRKKPLQTGMLVGGKMENDFALYSMDVYGAMSTGNYYAMGYAGYYAYGVLDKMYKEDMTIKEGLHCIKNCVDVLKNKFLLDVGKFIVKAVDREGVREYEIQA